VCVFLVSHENKVGPAYCCKGGLGVGDKIIAINATIRELYQIAAELTISADKDTQERGKHLTAANRTDRSGVDSGED